MGRMIGQHARAAGAPEGEQSLQHQGVTIARAGCSGVLTYHAAHAARLLSR